MDFSDAIDLLDRWKDQEDACTFDDPMDLDWSDQGVYFPSDFQAYQDSDQPVYQNPYQASATFSGIRTQAWIPTTPVAIHRGLLTPLASPATRGYGAEDVSFSGSFTPARDSAVSQSYLATPPSREPYQFVGFGYFGDTSSNLDFTFHEPLASTASPSFQAHSHLASPYSEALNSTPAYDYSFLNPTQSQSPTRLLPAFEMGQESSQMLPPTANNQTPNPPSARARDGQPPIPRAQSTGWNAINKSPPAQSSVKLTSSKREDRSKTKRKRVEQAPTLPNSQRASQSTATRFVSLQAKSPSSSPSPVSAESSVADQSPQPTSRVETPCSDGSKNTARTPMSAREIATEESEAETSVDGEVSPPPKRRKTSRTPTTPTPPATPVANGRRVPRSGDRTRASASGSPQSSATPPRLNAGRRPRQQQETNTGRYTEAEIARLERAVHTWRDDHNLTQKAMNDLLNSNARANDFPGGLWDFICSALSHRERHSVQKAVKRKFNNRKRGTWTPDDDAELCALYKMYKNQWQRIGEENNRGAEASRDRWRNYCKNGSAQEKGEWTPAEEKRFAQLMRDTVQVLVQQRIKDIKAGKSVPERFEPAELMDFGILSEKMGGTRSRLQCRNKFEKFKKRDSQNLDFINKPMDSLNGLEFEASTQKAKRKSQAKPRKSSARVSEEAEALHNYNEKMLIGDKYNILLGIQKVLIQTGITNEADIPWDDVVEADNQLSWSILDRKIVLQRMQAEYPSPDEESSCIDVVTGITEILESEYVDDPETLEVCYKDRPRSTGKQRTYSKKASRARDSISALKIADQDEDESPARSLPTPGSMDDDDDEEDGI
ncbi:hypothetical protein FKW77_004593 [Venturia effusa]|uniref:Myb-like domain-containing protein n=1 Tax=Venturia effusa TaxID=50376 RepID=A0A517LR68_9PEZI|nr:hypothetical protein FKW77_004593 [Venturia effusa]